MFHKSDISHKFIFVVGWVECVSVCGWGRFAKGNPI